MNEFDNKIKQVSGGFLYSDSIDTIQVNIGLCCNQLCRHCHVQAGPKRKELMSWGTMEQVLALARKVRPKLVDITGGAPEMNPNLGRFIRALQKDGHKVQVRTNLTILLEEDMMGMIHTYRDTGVKLVASFPCYMKPEVDHVRGDGVFEKSIEALKRLRAAGYGRDKSLVLDLVFNPEEDFLPPKQSDLQKEYEEILSKEYGIWFNNIITIANMPVGRFLEWLKSKGKDINYMRLLKENFNPVNVQNLMCKTQIDIGYDGSVYDCDFNLGRGIKVGHGTPTHIKDFDPARHAIRRIATADHCFGCTAGAGSSCGGSLERK